MAIDKNKLRIALSQIREDEMGYFLSSQFIDLMHPLPNIAERINKPRLFKCLQYIQDDLWNLETIALRLKWQKELCINDEIDEDLWLLFAAADISFFYIEFRSIFDYLAKVIGEISDLPDQIPSSYEKLENWIIKSDNAKKLDNELAQIVQSCTWFDETKEIRDSVVHRGATTLVFRERSKILFQVHQGLKNKISIPEVMDNPYVVNFELYAGLYLGYLIAYLEEISKPLYRLLNLNETGGRAKSYHSGLKVVHDWIESVVSL
jgi:hypothetical protein